LGYIADVLNTVATHVENKEYMQAAKYLEEECGDFSPDLAFSETMRGHVCEPHHEHAQALSNSRW